MDQTLIHLVRLLITSHQISIDKKELAFQIQSHPSYPSLHAVTGVLDHFGIDNLALDVPATDDVYNQLPAVFLARVLHEDDEQFALISKKGNTVEVRLSSTAKINISSAHFLEMFTGILVVIEPNEAVVTASNSSQISSNLIPIVLGVLVLGTLFIAGASFLQMMYVGLSMTGLVISIAIVQQHAGIKSILGDTFCSTQNPKKDCQSVLTSKGANLIANFKLSDACVVYFGTLTLVSLFLIVQGTLFTLLLALSLLALPMVVYTIVYQFTQKTWCPLCLLIAAVIIVQGSLAMVHLEAIWPLSFDLTQLLLLLTIGLAVAMLWNYISTKMESLLRLEETKIEYFRFKRNFTLFQAALEKSPRIQTDLMLPSEMVFGNPSAALNIVVITSPFCGHCQPVHNTLEEILRVYGERVAITIRFNVDTEKKDRDLYKITSRLVELFYQNPTDCLQAMHQIYAGTAVEKWFASWGPCQDSKMADRLLGAHSMWCKANQLHFTPEILINGHSFPSEYRRNELTYFIEDLIEQHAQETIQLVVEDI